GYTHAGCLTRHSQCVHLNAHTHVHAQRLDSHPHSASIQDTARRKPSVPPTSTCILNASCCVDARAHTLDSHMHIHTNVQ
ncbi:hypothetical protein BJV77DRAFT_1057164, partial [Russula vinacea]